MGKWLIRGRGEGKSVLAIGSSETELPENRIARNTRRPNERRKPELEDHLLEEEDDVPATEFQSNGSKTIC